MDEPTTQSIALQRSPQELLEAIRFCKDLPKEELLEISKRRDEFVPLLLAELDRASQIGFEANEADQLPIFSAYLLSQFRETRALDIILDYFALDGQNEKVDLFGDVIASDGGAILSGVGFQNPEKLRAYIVREDVSEWAVAAAMAALVYLAHVDAEIRKSTMEFFHSLFDEMKFGDDCDRWGQLLFASCKLNAREFLPKLEELFRLDLIDPLLITLEDVRDEAQQRERDWKETSVYRDRPIENIADSISWWGMFSEWESTEGENEAEEKKNKEEWENAKAAMIASLASQSTPTVLKPVRSEPKTGRNDPCPCGSGKKYKKCCFNVTQAGD